jgi:hypothetical protein
MTGKPEQAVTGLPLGLLGTHETLALDPDHPVSDVDRSGREVDVVPTDGERLTDPRAGRGHERGQVRQRPAHGLLVGDELAMELEDLGRGDRPLGSFDLDLDRSDVADRVSRERPARERRTRTCPTGTLRAIFAFDLAVLARR